MRAGLFQQLDDAVDAAWALALSARRASESTDLLGERLVWVAAILAVGLVASAYLYRKRD